MGDGHDPHGYSTRVGSGYGTDGYSVKIDPATLRKSVDTFRKQLAGKSTQELTDTARSALIAEGAFGSIPNALGAAEELRRFVNEHAHAMQQMGISLADFVAHVQAAAEIGYEADPATKQAAALALRMIDAKERAGRM